MATATSVRVSRRDALKLGAAVAVSSAALATAALAEEAPENRVCQIFGIEKPVVQACMLGLTSPELAAAVSNAGGLGILELPDADTVAAARALTDKPLCCAYYSYSDESAQILRDNAVDIVLCFPGPTNTENGFTNSVENIALWKEAGFKVLYKGLNATKENILRAQDAGADVIAVLGYGAGGCGPKIVSNVAELVAYLKDDIDVPLIAAGGIVNGKTAAFAAAAGAEGAYMGTRFLASVESPCGEATKQAIVDAMTEDLVPVPFQSGSDGWMLMTPSPLREEGLAMAAEGAAPADIMGVTAVVYASMATGDIAETGICVGCGVCMIDEVKPAAEIVEDVAAAFLA